MGALGHYLEEEGIATVGISLIRPQTENTKPPRALWVPFELGRPFGPPSDPEFQNAVNHYVHDFEAMLRRVLHERDGGMIAVTLMSSDMGKLYAALSQAIDKRR